MKTKILLSLSILIASIFFIASCQNDDSAKSLDNNSIVTKVKKPDQMISLQEAHKLYEAYQKNFISKSNNTKQAKYGWHSLDFYKKYIAYLEQEAAKNNIEVTGLRLYFAAYPEDPDTYGDKAGYQTYMFVPTYFDASKNIHRPFDPALINDKNQPVAVEKILKSGPDVFKNASWLQKTNQSTGVANMGQMCQPNCPSME
ncbi:hypothetical protein [Aquimarina celericrescens]|uniref:Uncharacterized protein n=1 Tax=Aquimarina celericrescens TaxID=1964542 RepID=A0ABW5B2J5_9FLAO|nr:hypothetical protein [Aquimarina celericrescens]